MPVLDPNAFSLTPSLVLTMAGGSIAAGMITLAIQILRSSFPFIANRSWEKPMALIGSLAITAYAYAATVHTPEAVGILAVIAAGLGIARLSMGIADTAMDAGILGSGSQIVSAKADKAVSEPVPALDTVRGLVRGRTSTVKPWRPRWPEQNQQGLL